MKSVLLYNPVAGRDRKSRASTIEQLVQVLNRRGFQVCAFPTVSIGSGAEQSLAAVKVGAKAVFACGGDGTVHDVLQGIAHTEALLGIIPIGSANALARELKIPVNPFYAASSLDPKTHVEMQTTAIRRAAMPPVFSLCMAGAGPDALLMYRMLTVNRSRLGRWRYYEQALRMFLLHRFPSFGVEIWHHDGGRSTHPAICAMALRIGDLGGLFSGIACGASVQADELHVVLVAPPAKLTLPLWFLTSWLGLQKLHPGVSVVKAIKIRMEESVPSQVDGEWIGKSSLEIALDGPMQRVLVPQGCPRRYPHIVFASVAGFVRLG